MNRSEEITFRLCKETFLSLWSFATPYRGNGKELCDVLVVFGRHIIILSVKEIEYDQAVEEPIASKRWQRKAVGESARQIYSAQRWIARNAPILTRERKSISLPSVKDARIYRIGIALGSKGKVPLQSRDFGKGHIHFHDERSIDLLLRELDTVRDFVDYLAAIESLVSRGMVMVDGGQENLLAIYLHNNRSFPAEKFNLLLVGGDEWESFKSKPEVKLRKEEDRISYVWDMMIEDVSKFVRDGTLEYVSNPGQPELGLRTMAEENRFNRRILGRQIDDMLRTTPKTHRRGRITQSPSGVVYVLLLSERGRDRADRRRELEYRCYVARDMVPTLTTVVGIATETHDPADRGRSFDVCYIFFEEWTEEHRRMVQEIRDKLGYFTQAQRKHVQTDEYPIINKPEPQSSESAAVDTRTDTLKMLEQRFPVTVDYLLRSGEFGAIARQLSLEAYKDWEILEAGCRMVINYRLVSELNGESQQLSDSAQELPEYVETAYSQFPPAGFFLLRKVRLQIDRDRTARIKQNRYDLSDKKEIHAEEVSPISQPQNCIYARTRDGFDLWEVFFPDFDQEEGKISVSSEWTVRIGCDCTDSVSFQVCQELANDLAKYATMIDFCLDQFESTRKSKLSVSVVEETLFRKSFAETYTRALEGRPDMGDEPLILAWRGPDDKPHVKLGVNVAISQHPRMKRLSYAMRGILECIGGLQRSEAAEVATRFVESLE